MMKKQKKGKGKNFWNNEYGGKGRNGGHLALSTEPSEDMLKFTRWLERETKNTYLNHRNSVLDLGCGNGRNIVHLGKTYGMQGIGYDISEQAIAQAAKVAEADGLRMKFASRSIAGTFDIPDESQVIVLDMMVSHFLNKDERAVLIAEVARLLIPGGYLFFKTFLLDGDKHAERMIKEHPAEEQGSYIHQKIGATEHVFTEDEIDEALAPYFQIRKVQKSHGHLRNKAKRRSICVYAERI